MAQEKKQATVGHAAIRELGTTSSLGDGPTNNQPIHSFYKPSCTHSYSTDQYIVLGVADFGGLFLLGQGIGQRERAQTPSEHGNGNNSLA